MKKILGILISAAMIICQLPHISAVAADEKELYYQERMDFYKSFDINDPQHIDDIDFFGKWDEESESWINEPCFDYERFPELSNIEEAAKMSDYELCKEETLKFYREYLKTHRVNLGSGTISRCYRLVGEMMMEGLSFSATDLLPMGRIKLTSDVQEYQVDIFEALKEDMAKQANYMTVSVLDIKKDGYRSVFYSVGSEYEPYIILTVNGSPRKYMPAADKTIYPAERINEQHTGEGLIYANESYTSINPDRNCIPPESLIGKPKSDFDFYKQSTAFKPVDQYTSRGYLRFDFSDIGKNDKVSGGTLHIWGYMDEDDNVIRSEETKEEIEAFIADDRKRLWTQDSSWAASGPDTVFSYDEEFGPTVSIPVVETSGQWDNGVFSPNSTTKYLKDLYIGTGNEVYAYHALRFIINIILKTGGNPPITSNQALEVPMRSVNVLRDLYAFMDSEHMTPEYFTIILKYFHVINDYLVSGWNYESEGANGGSLHTASLLKVGMTFHQFKRYWDGLEELKDPSVGGSMQGGWLNVGLFRSKYKLGKTVLEGGTPVEVPLGYVDTNVSALYEPYKYAEETLGMGEEIKSNIDAEMAELFRSSAKYVINLSNPIGGTWRSGDDSNYTSKIGQYLSEYALFFLSENDPVLEWAYSGGKSGNPPQGYTSFVNNDVNRLVLRSSWAQDAVALYMDADGGWRNHGHNDDLSVNLMAYGKFMLYDPGVGSYFGQDALVSWQRSTRAHNTIEINEVSQKGYITGGKKSGPNGEKIYYPSKMAFTKGGTAEEDIRPISDFNESREFLGKNFNFVSANTGGYIDNEWLNGDFDTRRDVLYVKPGYFIVTDRIEPENGEIENSYTQNWHLNPEMKYEIEESTKNIVSKDSNGANIMIVPVGNEELEVSQKTGYYSPRGANNTTMLEGVYTSYDKKAKGTVTYNTLIFPLAEGDTKSITTEKLALDIANEKANAFSAVIEDGSSGQLTNISYYTLFDENEKAERKFGNYKTDGTLAFVENTGDTFPSFYIKNGKSLKVDGGKTLFENSNEVDNLSVRIEGNTLKIETDEEELLDYSKLKIYCKDNVSSVTVNNSSCYYEQKGGYVYFMQTNIPDDSEETVEKEPVHSSSSSSSGGGGGSKNDDNKKEEPPKKEETSEDNVIMIEFKDIENHWAEESIKTAIEKGIVQGDENGNFNPEKTLTRAEMITMLMRTLPNEEEYADEFSDVNKNDWYASYVSKALKYNVISSGNTFRPNDAVTREEMCKMIVNVYSILFGRNFDKEEITFADKNNISEWAIDYVKSAVALNLMNGYENGDFLPQGNATRAEAVTTICRMLK